MGLVNNRCLEQRKSEKFFDPKPIPQRVPSKQQKGVPVKVDVEENEIKTGLIGNAQQQYSAICKAYERYADPLASFILERVAPTLDTAELTTAVNNVFIELARKARAGNFQQRGALASLLFQMARYNAIDIMRQRNRRWEREVPFDVAKKHLDTSGTAESDEEIAMRVAQKLKDAPQVARTWQALAQAHTPANETLAEEIKRQFKILVGSLIGLQRKVAGIIAANFGGITNGEICDLIAKTGPRPPLSSVKSARREIREKFKAFLQAQERRVQS
jgi:DNA-directed RNA polymerase specialized sigma24 family protein